MKRLYTLLALPYIHDPSTLAECDGKYYAFGTGGGGLISDDGWAWHGGAVRPGGGAAPDVMKIGDRYLIIYGATGGGLGGGHNGRILTMWNKTLDPESPDLRFSKPVEVYSSDGLEDQDAIDPCLFLGPYTGRLWVTYGTYFGSIRLIELDPGSHLSRRMVLSAWHARHLLRRAELHLQYRGGTVAQRGRSLSRQYGP